MTSKKMSLLYRPSGGIRRKKVIKRSVDTRGGRVPGLISSFLTLALRGEAGLHYSFNREKKRRKKG